MAKKFNGGVSTKASSVQTVRSAQTGKFVTKDTPTRPASQHVIPNDKGWSVRKSNASRAGRVFDTQKEAVGYAKDVAKKDRSEVIVHRPDGTIREVNSYSSDPSRKKG